MNDLDLLMFGCIVTFIGVAGAYVYVRESFLAGANSQRRSKPRDSNTVEHEISEVS